MAMIFSKWLRTLTSAPKQGLESRSRPTRRALGEQRGINFRHRVRANNAHGPRPTSRLSIEGRRRVVFRTSRTVRPAANLSSRPRRASPPTGLQRGPRRTGFKNVIRLSLVNTCYIRPQSNGGGAGCFSDSSEFPPRPGRADRAASGAAAAARCGGPEPSVLTCSPLGADTRPRKLRVGLRKN